MRGSKTNAAHATSASRHARPARSSSLGRLNSQRCIAFQTQTKGFLPDEFRTKIGNRIYGCDTCQMVCPKNKGVDFHLHPEMEPDPEIAKPLLKPLLTMSNREFKEKFGHVAGSWRGKKPIQRNAIIALAHFKETDALPELIEPDAQRSAAGHQGNRRMGCRKDRRSGCDE